MENKFTYKWDNVREYWVKYWPSGEIVMGSGANAGEPEWACLCGEEHDEKCEEGLYEVDLDE